MISRKSRIGNGRRIISINDMKLLTATLIYSAALCAADLKLGKPLQPGEPLSVSQVLASPGQYVGKTVQVKGKVTEVCKAMGCWMSLTDGEGHLIRVQVDHEGAIKFPQSSVGKTAIAEGKLEREEMTQEEAVAAAKHEAEENGRHADTSTIKSGLVVYQLAGTGALILDK